MIGNERVKAMGSNVGDCLVCEAQVELVLDFGFAPAVNKLRSAGQNQSPTFPLSMNSCRQCSHAQQSFFVAPEFLFEDYVYASGTSSTLIEYFDWLANGIVSSSKNEFDSLLEIGCNDGSFLDVATVRGMKVIGVDPATEMVDLAVKRGHEAITAFWPDVPDIVERKFDVVVAQNVVAHVPNPVRFLQGVVNHMAETGIVLIQTSQVDMLQTGQFDTIYHEHYSFFTPRSMRTLLTRLGLVVYGQVKVDIHGGSLLTVAGKRKEFDCSSFMRGSFFLEEIPPDEEIDYVSLYEEFPGRVFDNLEMTRLQVAQARRRGEKIVFVGAAAKAITYLHISGIEVDLLVDESQFKIGRREPSSGQVISDMQMLGQVSEPVFAIISAWNFTEELVRKVSELRTGLRTSFFRYFPHPDLL